jgi:2-methylcitrate dehydratase PrpD
MPNETRELVRFGVETVFEDLPDEVRHEAKRVFLDSVGCALGGIMVDKARFSIQFARGLGASNESTILGTGDKVSSAAAAFANGELINALDMDAILAPAHISPFVIPASLALAESRGASGKDLIIAIALGHEISTRIGRALVTMSVTKDGEFKPAEVHGFSSAIIGGAIGAGKILKLGGEKMLHSVGLAGHMAPVAAEAKWRMTAPSGMDKYLSAGLISFAEVTAALLAEMGYTGDPTVLEGDYGFWKFFGAKAWLPQNLLQKLGDEWLFLETSYKPYPCCRLIHGALDCFLEIIEENHLMPEDIQSLVVLGHPLAIAPVWKNMELITHVDAQFSLSYAFAVVAHRIPTIDWQEVHIMKNPRILEFMKKVNFDSHPDFGKAWLKNHQHNLSSIEVVAKGQTFKREKLWARGDYFLEEARMKDDDLEEKFRANASRTLRPENTDKAVRAVFGLEKMHHISELLTILSS